MTRSERPERPEGMWDYCGGPSAHHLRKLQEYRIARWRRSAETGARRSKIEGVAKIVLTIIAAAMVWFLVYSWLS